MGWKIINDKEDVWHIFSSITDDIIATFKTERELIKFIATERIYKGKLSAIETLLSFPDGWTINDNRMFKREKSKLYYDWHMSILKLKTYEEYYGAIDNKLKELLEL